MVIVTISMGTGIPMKSEINNFCNWLENHCEWIDDHPPIWMYNICFLPWGIRMYPHFWKLPAAPHGISRSGRARARHWPRRCGAATLATRRPGDLLSTEEGKNSRKCHEFSSEFPSSMNFPCQKLMICFDIEYGSRNGFKQYLEGLPMVLSYILLNVAKCFSKYQW